MRESKCAYPRVALQIEKNRAHGRALLKGIADYALEHTNWRLELVDPAQLADVAYVRQFDGLIVRVTDDATADALARSRRPVVDTYSRNDKSRLAAIRLDDTAIAEMAFACFEEHHYRHFAYCGFNGLRFSEVRGAAFRAFAEGRGFGCVSYVAPPKFRMTDKFFLDEKTVVPDAENLGGWLKSLPKPVALFCCNDLRAVQVLHVCMDNGISVPKQIAVMGVDNDVLLCTFAKPSLSSIDTDPFSLGRRAAEMLEQQMRSRARGEGVRKKGILHVPKRVVERLSTDAYPYDTPWLGEAMRYIRSNLTHGVTSADVVRHVGYSHPKVNKAFVNERGTSIKKEILAQRSRMACMLLKDSDYTLAEIAARCGYRSPQYFSTCFAEEFKVTPDVWRKSGKA